MRSAGASGGRYPASGTFLRAVRRDPEFCACYAALAYPLGLTGSMIAARSGANLSALMGRGSDCRGFWARAFGSSAMNPAQARMVVYQ